MGSLIYLMKMFPTFSRRLLAMVLVGDGKISGYTADVRIHCQFSDTLKCQKYLQRFPKQDFYSGSSVPSPALAILVPQDQFQDIYWMQSCELWSWLSWDGKTGMEKSNLNVFGWFGKYSHVTAVKYCWRWLSWCCYPVPKISESCMLIRTFPISVSSVGIRCRST